MPALLPEAAPAPRHARRATPCTRRASAARASRALVFAAVVVSGTAFVVGPATAHEAPAFRPSRPPSTSDLDAPWVPSPAATRSTTFQAMLDEAPTGRGSSGRSRISGRVVEAAHERARRLAAKVRASRAALRSEVVRPVSGGYHLTARFGDSSSRWGSGRHTGLDFACSVGTPVHAVADGVVISAGYSGAYGNRIEVRHADGTVTTYNHLSRIEVHGGSVKAGRVIGLVGVTGNTTGAHLHFEVVVRRVVRRSRALAGRPLRRLLTEPVPATPSRPGRGRRGCKPDERAYACKGRDQRAGPQDRSRRLDRCQ